MPFNIGPNALSNDDIDVSRNDDGDLVIVDKENDERISIGPDGLSTESLQTGEASIDSLPTTLDQITGEHDNFAPTMQPRGLYHEGTNRTYIVSNRVDVDGNKLRIECLFFDHDDDEWSDIYHVDSVTLDRHYTGVVTVDDDGYVYLVYDAMTNPLVAKSTTPHDISTWENMGRVPETRNYRHIRVINNELHLWTKPGNPEDGPISYHVSTDKAESWETRMVLDDGYGLYPYASALENGRHHLYISARQGYSGPGQQFEYIAHIYYDVATDTFHGSDGTELTIPAAKDQLDASNAVIVERPDANQDGTVVGSAFDVDPSGNIHVAYLRGEDGVGVDFEHSYFDGSTWTSTGVIDGQFNFDNQFLGSSMELVATGDEIRVYEVMSNRTGATKSIGRYTSTDNGATWSDREPVREYPESDYGFSKVQKTWGDGPMQWQATESVDPSEAEPNIPAKMFGMDGEFADIVASQPPKRAQQHTSPSTQDIDVFNSYLWASLSEPTTLASGTSQVPFDNIREDESSGWDAETNRYVVPRSGRYQVDITVTINNPVAGNNYNLGLWRDENPRGTTNVHEQAADAGLVTLSLTMNKYFSQGTELGVFLFLSGETEIAGDQLTSQRTVFQMWPDVSDPRFWG